MHYMLQSTAKGSCAARNSSQAPQIPWQLVSQSPHLCMQSWLVLLPAQKLECGCHTLPGGGDASDLHCSVEGVLCHPPVGGPLAACTVPHTQQGVSAAASTLFTGLSIDGPHSSKSRPARSICMSHHTLAVTVSIRTQWQPRGVSPVPLIPCIALHCSTHEPTHGLHLPECCGQCPGWLQSHTCDSHKPVGL